MPWWLGSKMPKVHALPQCYQHWLSMAAILCIRSSSAHALRLISAIVQRVCQSSLLSMAVSGI